MVLSAEDRGMLEKIIDAVIATIKEQKKMFENPIVKQEFHVEKIEDFLFGMFYQEITSTFSTFYTTFKHRRPNESELQEIVQVVLKRLPEIRNAIYFTE
ncbi:MAG: hypothetical protein ACREAF_00715 [Nitrosopumilaceae archaeon]